MLDEFKTSILSGWIRLLVQRAAKVGRFAKSAAGARYAPPVDVRPRRSLTIIDSVRSQRRDPTPTLQNGARRNPRGPFAVSSVI